MNTHRKNCRCPYCGQRVHRSGVKVAPHTLAHDECLTRIARVAERLDMTAAEIMSTRHARQLAHQHGVKI